MHECGTYIESIAALIPVSVMMKRFSSRWFIKMPSLAKRLGPVPQIRRLFLQR